MLNFTDFIRFFFGEDEVKSSLDNIKYIKNETRSLVGQKITAICTEEQKISFLEQMDLMITGLDYGELVEEYDNTVPDDRPHNNDFDAMLDNYLSKKRYSILLKDSYFAESFFTAEWIYVKALPILFENLFFLIWAMSSLIGSRSLSKGGLNENSISSSTSSLLIM
ncbi:MAG: hypothetical protein PUC64_05420 [Clostridium sp.]|nr:hypothetical protein [Clostridium sp.]